MEGEARIFRQQKLTNLSKVDLSRKGSIDEPIVDLVHFINELEFYFTTSSCSGRIYVFEENREEEKRKKGCKWLFTTHGTCEPNQLIEALNASTGDAVLKFEPLVLHVQCQSLNAAQFMHMVAVAAGFRNSGITVGKRGKIMAAVRSTQTLEVPLTSNGQLLVDAKYISYVAEVANNKMKENFERLHGFFERLKNELQQNPLSCSDAPEGKSVKKTKVKSAVNKSLLKKTDSKQGQNALSKQTNGQESDMVDTHSVKKSDIPSDEETSTLCLNSDILACDA